LSQLFQLLNQTLEVVFDVENVATSMEKLPERLDFKRGKGIAIGRFEDI
jgi:hypothetical protein